MNKLFLVIVGTLVFALTFFLWKTKQNQKFNEAKIEVLNEVIAAGQTIEYLTTYKAQIIEMPDTKLSVTKSPNGHFWMYSEILLGHVTDKMVFTGIYDGEIVNWTGLKLTEDPTNITLTTPKATISWSKDGPWQRGKSGPGIIRPLNTYSE